MVSSGIAFGLTAFAVLSTVQAAQAGTNVHACFYAETAPIEPELVMFSTKAIQCMDDIGNDANLTIGGAGVACISVGYVEGKGYDTGGDNCVVNHSIWSLAYKTNSSGSSGSTEATLTYHVFSSNTFTLKGYTPGTKVCAQGSLCDSTKYDWNTGVGDAYVIFNPSATTSSSNARGSTQGSSEQQVIGMPAEEL